MIRTENIRRTRDRARRGVEARNAMSTWTVTRPGTGGTTDPETGDWVPAVEFLWTGDGFYADTSRPFVKVRADTALTVEQPNLCVNYDAPRFKKGDTVAVAVDDSGNAINCDDPILLERSWRIVGEPGSSYNFHRHYPLDEVTPS